MWKFFWWVGAASDQQPLSLVMLDQSNLPPEWSSCTIGRVTSNVNHFSFQNIHMIGMPFQTWLLDLKFQNDRVTCFGNRIAMNCFSFQPGSWPTHAYPNHLSSQISTGWMHLEINAALHCLLSFPECHFQSVLSFAVASLRFPSWPHPHQTPSLRPFRADVVILQIQARQGGVLLQSLGQCLEGQETHDLRNTMKHTAHTIPQSCKKSSRSSSMFFPSISLGFMQQDSLC